MLNSIVRGSELRVVGISHSFTVRVSMDSMPVFPFCRGSLCAKSGATPRHTSRAM